MHAQWVGYIKDYDGGTLMECVINERLPYTGFPNMIRAQRAALDRHIRALSNAHVVRPGLTAFQQLGPHPAVPKAVAIADIPGDCWGVLRAGRLNPPWMSMDNPQYNTACLHRFILHDSC